MSSLKPKIRSLLRRVNDVFLGIPQEIRILLILIRGYYTVHDLAFTTTMIS
jgi:hypothetical protein